MAFEYLTNVPLEKVRQDYLDALLAAGLTARSETLPTLEATNRVTAQAVYARISSPHYNACAMDGIALQASQLLAPQKPLRCACLSALTSGSTLVTRCQKAAMPLLW